jgi:hypothetical protein
LLQNPEEILQELDITNIQDYAVIIVPGGYDEAGLHERGSDSVTPPPAFDYWQQQIYGISRNLPKGEVHGYMVHHLLMNWLVVPVPALGLILLAGIGSKAIQLNLNSLPPSTTNKWVYGLAGCTIGYGLLSLQLYVSSAVLLPWLLPSLTIWLLILPIVWEKHNDS